MAEQNSRSFLISSIITLVVVVFTFVLLNWLSEVYLGKRIPIIVFILVFLLVVSSTIVPGYFYSLKRSKNQTYSENLLYSNSHYCFFKICSYLGIFSSIPFFALRNKNKEKETELVFFHSSQGVAITLIRYIVTIIALMTSRQKEVVTNGSNTVMLIAVSLLYGFILLVIGYSILGWIMAFKGKRINLFGISLLAKSLRGLVKLRVKS